MKRGVFAACLLLASWTSAMAEIAWRWQEGGKWVYGDKYPRDAISLERVGQKGQVIENAVAGSVSQNIQNEKASKLFPVVLYGVGCEGCEKAKKLLESRRIPFIVKDPSKQEIFIEFKTYSPQSLAPVMLVGEKVLIGYEEVSWSASLDDAGYDKAVVSINSKQGADPKSEPKNK